jgi:hypothetical protein
MHSGRIAHRQTGRPEANSASVYEADPVEVSRLDKSAYIVQAPARSRRFVHVAPNLTGKPFKLHDDVLGCRP